MQHHHHRPHPILWIMPISWFAAVMLFGIYTKKITWHIPIVLTTILIVLVALYYAWHRHTNRKR